MPPFQQETDMENMINKNYGSNISAQALYAAMIFMNYNEKDEKKKEIPEAA